MTQPDPKPPVPAGEPPGDPADAASGSDAGAGQPAGRKVGGRSGGNRQAGGKGRAVRPITGLQETPTMTQPGQDLPLSEDAPQEDSPTTPGQEQDEQSERQEGGQHGRPSDDSDPGHS